METKYKYAFIVSQYYHSYNTEVVALDEYTEEEYKQKLVDYIKEVMRMKNPDLKKELEERYSKYFNELYARQNINDEGDIYVLHFTSLGSLKYGIERFTEEHEYHRKPKKRGKKENERVREDIRTYHDIDKLTEIFEKHFG